MSRIIFSAICWLLFIACPLSGQETIPSSVRKSTEVNVETEIARLLEKSKAEIDFCKKNRGLSFDEVDMSKMGDREGYQLGFWTIYHYSASSRRAMGHKEAGL